MALGLLMMLLLALLFVVLVAVFGLRNAILLLLFLLALGALYWLSRRPAGQKPATPIVLPVEDDLYPDTPDATPDLLG